MKRARAVTPGLKHLAFFEELTEAPAESPRHRAATAGLLTLRLLDHWILTGSTIVEPESVSVRSVRQAIMSIPANDPQREVLLGLVNTMQTLREVDLQPILPRLFAFGELTEKRAMLPLAADVYLTIARLGDAAYDSDLLMDSNMRLGFCLRMMGSLKEAEDAYVSAGRIAKRRREIPRLLHSRIGVAKVAMERGNLPAADQLLGEVAAECAQRGFESVQAMALHDQSVVARKRGDNSRAVCLAYESLERTSQSSERERILNDIAATFISMDRFGEARTALLLQEATATSVEVRCFARVNLMALAAREGDRPLFLDMRQTLQSMNLPPVIRANFLIESARGVRQFGEAAEAARLLAEAIETARAVGLNRECFEAEEMLALGDVTVETTSGEHPAFSPDPAAHVVVGLRRMLASLSAT